MQYLRIVSSILVFIIILSTMIVVNAYPVYLNIHSFRKSVVVYAPAVTRSGEGAVLRVNLTIVYPGSGMVYFSAKPLVEPDTQATARIAAYVASTITGRNFYSYDYYVVMTSNSLVVGGPSAGGLMTIGFISLFLNKTLNPNVTMTGMINPDGSIGPVGGLLGKLHAVADNGFKVFLIPIGQRIVYVEKRIVKRVLWGYYETIKYAPIDLVKEGEKLNVTVIEVGNIFDAMKYFLGITVKPIKGAEIVMNNSVLNIIDKFAWENYVRSINLFNESKKLFNQLDLFTRIQLYDQINNVEEMNYQLKQLIDKNLSIASFIYSNKVLKENIYINWLYKSMLGKLNLENTMSMINETINDLHYKLSNAGPGLNPLLIESHELYFQALTNYIGLLGKNNTSFTTSDIEKLADIVVKLYFSDQLLNISSMFGKENLNITDSFMTLYSLSDSVVSYAYSLANDVGGGNQYIAEAVNYFQDAVNAYTTNYTAASIGLLIDSITYADIGIETLFIQNNTAYSNITTYLMREHLIYYNLTTIKDYMNYTFTASNQYIYINDYVDSMYVLLKGIMYASIFMSKNSSLNLIENTVSLPPNTPAINPSNKTETPANRLPSNNTGINEINTSIHDMGYYVLGIITGFALGLITYYIYSATKRRKGESLDI
ncbi:S16 family serine protease [Staphylothermus hellenicus]|uniref:Serine protease-like protein n=1 Tax=Staphylothermus hellenicus (strain DSM 12710 / JCM 10830 / BK20S6-10-b1 / P8) TaxID=591019 RepID=D7D7Z2_STAHD|nr:S16 family serine protease [Staphylothermus hellenicus]ADI31888.1 serine protease-like protein [Staphylothermus hellenicus DSM 12710]